MEVRGRFRQTNVDRARSMTDRDCYDSWSFAVGFTTGVVLSGVALMIGFWFT
jgi:hypothetical protein